MLRPYGVAIAAIAAALMLSAIACNDEAPQVDVEYGPGPPYTSTVILGGDGATGGVPLEVEIADTPEKRAKGLMDRESLPDLAGMLFVWPEDTASGFWMKDTLIPLSIAFIDANGVIVHIEDMEPLDETLHRSPKPYRWTVEANQGWFEEHGIGVGDTTQMPDGIAGGS